MFISACKYTHCLTSSPSSGCCCFVALSVYAFLILSVMLVFFEHLSMKPSYLSSSINLLIIFFHEYMGWPYTMTGLLLITIELENSDLYCILRAHSTILIIDPA